VLENVRNSAGGLDASGTRTDHEEVEVVRCSGPALHIRRFEQPKEPGPETLCIPQRVHWKCVRICARNAEEISLAPSSKDEKVSLVGVTALTFDCSRREIDRNHHRHLYVNILMMKKHVPKIEGGIFGRQNACCNLVKQRLELLIIVLVD
jgi:hypothetical protein